MRVAVVVNPIGRRAARALAALERSCSAQGWPAPTVHQTSIASPGAAQATAASAAGVQLVVAIGGDGLVREVAGSLADCGTHVGDRPLLGIVPTGTANLFARNLGVPLDDVDAAVAVALGLPGRARAESVDLGRTHWRTADGFAHEGTFAVVLGIGNDARTVSLVRPAIKRRLGWMAYFEPALRTMAHRPFTLAVAVDDDPPEQIHAWSLLVGNVSRIPLGIVIFPDARPTDRLLHVLRVQPRHAGSWVVIAAKGALGHHHEARELGYGTARTITVDSDVPLPIHLDGDYHQGIVHLRVTVLAGAVAVHVPRVGSRG